MKYAVKNLQPGDINPAPFKSLRSPLRDLLIIGENAKFARIDPAHTFAIDGIGKNFYASGILALMQIQHFGGTSTDQRFQNAYSSFITWCNAHRKQTSIYEFSYKSFKLPVGSLLVCSKSTLLDLGHLGPSHNSHGSHPMPKVTRQTARPWQRP